MVYTNFRFMDEVRNCDDKYNRSKSRNIRNTSKNTYNCGGFALNIYAWYQPDGEFHKNTDHNTENNTVCNRITYESIRQMLHEISTLRLIDDITELQDGEYALAFRWSHDGDFHFVKRAKNGHWYHKQGRSQYIMTMKEEEVFSDCWYERYDGPMVLFANRTQRYVLFLFSALKCPGADCEKINY